MSDYVCDICGLIYVVPSLARACEQAHLNPEPTSTQEDDR